MCKERQFKHTNLQLRSTKGVCKESCHASDVVLGKSVVLHVFISRKMSTSLKSKPAAQNTMETPEPVTIVVYM